MTGGLTALGTGLYSIGIPKNSVMQYETEVKSGKLLLVAHGTSEDVKRTRGLSCSRVKHRRRRFTPIRRPLACSSSLRE